MYAPGVQQLLGHLLRRPAAPQGFAPAEVVVDALFYNFAPGEVARHIPEVWRTTTPEAAIAARQVGCVEARWADPRRSRRLCPLRTRR
jgi:hypothetical protein